MNGSHKKNCFVFKISTPLLLLTACTFIQLLRIAHSFGFVWTRLPQTVVNGDPLCVLCSGTATRILSDCKVGMSQCRYTWRHNKVLRSLGGSKVKRVAIQFVQEGKEVNKTIRRQGSLEDACDWEMQVDLRDKLVVPQEIASTTLRPDIVLWSRSRMRVYFIELTVPWEELVAEAYERKRLMYIKLGGRSRAARMES